MAVFLSLGIRGPLGWRFCIRLPRIIIIPSFTWQAIPLTIYKFLIFIEYLTCAANVNYDASSLSAISHMGIGLGKGVFTTVKHPPTKACVHRLITGGERWSG